MTRMFTGGRSGGEGSNVNPLFEKYGKHSAKKTFLDKARGIDESKLTPEERYKKTFDSKMAELKKKALEGGSKYKFSLPGTAQEEEKKISKTMEAFIMRAAMKKAKEEEKKAREQAQVQIKPKGYTGPYGGRIDAKGRIYGPGNQVVAKVDMKTGIVRSKSGTRICKYNPDSPYTDFKIVAHINRESNPNKATWHGGTKGNSPVSGGGMGSFYGHTEDKGGGFWG
jgi:hypothetical protein